MSGLEAERAAVPCDHPGECPRQANGCRWIQVERIYTPCACGGWDETFTDRTKSLRMKGRSNHSRGCLIRVVLAAVKDEGAQEVRERVEEALAFTDDPRGVSCGGLSIEAAGCFAGDLAARVRAALAGEATDG